MSRQSSKTTVLYCRMNRCNGDMDAHTARNQMEHLAMYAEETRLQNIKFFCDWGFPGTTPDRPVYQQMLQEIEKGNVSDLVVTNVSRLCRNFTTLHELTDLIVPRFGVTLHILQEKAVVTPQDARAKADRYNGLLAFFQQERQRGGQK